jgi:hypothetical protein
MGGIKKKEKRNFKKNASSEQFGIILYPSPATFCAQFEGKHKRTALGILRILGYQRMEG